MAFDRYITREDSACVYGFASVMLVFHHCYVNPTKIPCVYIGTGRPVIYLAWALRICVTMYSFISGYGMALKSCRAEKDAKNSAPLQMFRSDVKTSLRALMNFYQKFWWVFVFFALIGILFFDFECSPVTLLKGFFFGKAYCTEWWYVTKYLEFLVIFPLLGVILRYCEKNKKIIPVLVLLGLFGGCVVYRKTPFLVQKLDGRQYELTFCIAYMIARYGIFDKINRRSQKFPSIFWVIMAGMVIFLRSALVRDYSVGGLYDSLLTTIFVYCLVALLHTINVPVLKDKICALGSYSMYIWLIHPFFAYYYFSPFRSVSVIWPIVFLYVFVASYVAAWLLMKISRYVAKAFLF